MLFCDAHHLLPQTWTYGMLYVYRASRLRGSFLMGRHGIVGFRSYFPLAFLFKTPLATLVAFGVAMLIGLAALIAKWRHVSAGNPVIWAIASLLVPWTIFTCADLTARLNIGLRHMLPLYPFMFVATGCAAARAWQRWGGIGRALMALLAAGLLVETATAFPDDLAFFNLAAGGKRGGIRLLGDSNLDWGQDLPLLAKWQRQHPDRKLYLFYFGTADPAHYGIRYAPLPGYVPPHADVPSNDHLPTQPGVVAISATYLQGIYLDDRFKPIYQRFRPRQPLDVLGGSIYLYDYAP